MMLYLGAMALGALHAFEPGHGKTLIASYMVGTRGRIGDGVLLGFTVTFTHTFSVILLGLVAKVLSRTYSDTELHGYLGLFSALLILAVGSWMLWQRLKRPGAHHHLHLFGHAGHDHGHDHHHRDHDHGNWTDNPGHHHTHGPINHGHTHDHNHDHSHDHGHDHVHPHSHHHGPAASPLAGPGYRSKWELLLLGISGGLIPCPAAITTLLTAIGAGRIGEGLAMAVFFSLGLGLVMMSFGVTLAMAGNFTSRFTENQELGRRMSIASSLLIVVLGLYTLFHSLRAVF